MGCGIPSDKSKPRSPTFNLHFRIANCNTAQKRRGLKTHPCCTPPVMLNYLLRPEDPMTSPNCPSYNFDIIQTMCSEMRCSRKLFQSAGQWTRSNAFDKFKLTTHTGIPTAKVLPKKTFAVKRCSSMCFPRRGPCCSFRLVVMMFDFVQNKTCEHLVKQADVSYRPKISNLCWSRLSGQHIK